MNRADLHAAIALPRGAAGRAVAMIEQAAELVDADMGDPERAPASHAQRLRGAALLALHAAGELFVLSGWREAEQAAELAGLHDDELESAGHERSPPAKTGAARAGQRSGKARGRR